MIAGTGPGPGGAFARSWLLIVGVAVFATRAGAQRLSAADTLPDAAIAESVAVLNGLTQHVGLHTRDATAWHRLGMLAWLLAGRAESHEGPVKLDATRLGRLADTSLRIAADLAPQDVGYRLAVGRFLLASNVAVARTAARGHFEKALNVARASGVPSVHAEAALWYGRTFWWWYDALANRRLPTASTPPRSVSDAMRSVPVEAAAMLDQIAMLNEAAERLRVESGAATVNIAKITPAQIARVLGGDVPLGALGSGPSGSFKAARARILTGTQPLPDEVAGAADFRRAYDLFHEAYVADPAFPGAFRAIAMVLVERAMWVELESLAHAQTRVSPQNGLAWMALGLATHRQQKDIAASAAYDSATRVLGAAELTRLDNLERVLEPGARHAKLGTTDETRKAADRLYWMLADPVWADGVTRSRVEFLSRVTFSELRWTVEEFGLAGADTDRGDIYIRYGQPNEIAAIGPSAGETADITTFWMYSSGLVFAFRGMPTFATSHLAADDIALVGALEHAQPVRWDNVASPAIDSLAARVTRFRHMPGSVDVVVAARLAAPDSIRRTMDVKGDVRRALWLIARDSFTEYRADRPVDTAGVYSWTQRVRSGSFAYRVEEFGETAKRIGRATGTFDTGALAFAPLGFGISDVLLATAATTSAVPVRWNALRIVPLVGPIAPGANLMLLWESYELAQREAGAHYEVVVTLERERSAAGRSAAGRIGAEVVGALASAARLQRESDRVIIRVNRSVPYTPAFADQISLALGTTPSGNYVLTLEIIDQVTGKTAKTSTAVVIGR